MSQNTDSPFFKIEAFIRSEGYSTDIIFLDKIILSTQYIDADKAIKINALVNTIKERTNTGAKNGQ